MLIPLSFVLVLHNSHTMKTSAPTVYFCHLAQIVSNPTRFAAVHLAAERVRLEYVVVVEGTVQPRPDEMVNPNMPTGEVEVRHLSLLC